MQFKSNVGVFIYIDRPTLILNALMSISLAGKLYSTRNIPKGNPQSDSLPPQEP